MATLDDHLQELIVDLGTDWKNIWAKIGTGALDTTATNLSDALNEVLDAVGTGGAMDLDGLTDVTISSPATGHVVRFNGTTWVNALGTTHFDAAGAAASAQAASQPLEADLTAIAALTTTAYGRAFLELVNQAGLVALLPSGSTTAAGLNELASDSEALAMSAADRVLTPANLAAITNVNNGLAKLDGSGKVASAQLPSFVDDVLEVANFAALPGTGETGVIYTTLNDNNVWRWSGSAYVEIAASPGSTDAVTEGSTNLYFTNTRADARADARITALIGNPDADLAAAYVTAKA